MRTAAILRAIGKLKLVLRTGFVWSTSFSLLLAVARAEDSKPPEIFPISEIKPGLTGTTYTVLQGTNIVPIHTEIHGLLPNAVGPGHHLIIGRLNDEKTRLTFAVHGMSGSPLYIDGRIAGALSRRVVPFEKDAFCGFTPIQDMLDVDKLRDQPRPRAASPGRRLADVKSWFRPVAAPDGMAWQPLSIPLVVAGLPPRAFAFWTKEFADMNFLPVMGAGGAGVEQKEVPGHFEPGSPMTALLARGAFAIGGTGTLTYRNGNKVYGFGHPMLWIGSAKVPMARAEIIATVPSYLYPYKISNIGQVVGTITQDRLTAITGEVGPAPRMVPMRVEIAPSNGKAKTYEMELFDHARLTPRLVSSIFSSVSLLALEYTPEFSMDLEAEAEIDGAPNLKARGFYSGEDEARFYALTEFARKVDDLYNNPFGEPTIKRITIHAKVRESRREYRIEDVWLDKELAKPGETLNVRVGLRAFQGERRVETMSIVLPEELKSGEAKLLVGDADAMRRAESGLSATGSTGKSDSIAVVLPSTTREDPRSLAQWIEVLNKSWEQNRLYFRLSRATPGQLVQNERLTGLPPSAIAVRDSRKWKDGANKLSEAELLEKSVALDGVVTGSAELTVRIE